MEGSATLTIVTSSRVMNPAPRQIAKARQRAASGRSVMGAPVRGEGESDTPSCLHHTRGHRGHRGHIKSGARLLR